MNAPIKQHLIDPEICIRCHACVDACVKDAISFNDDNVVVDEGICDGDLACIGPCPTGAIDSWLIVGVPFSVGEQLSWMELPEQPDLQSLSTSTLVGEHAPDATVIELLAEARRGAGGVAVAPASAALPVSNLFGVKSPLRARVQGNFRLTAPDADADVRHIVLDLGEAKFPFLEGQTVGIVPPGKDEKGRPHLTRLYSISSPRDGERPNTNNISLTIKREESGICSNFACDLTRDDEVELTGPFGASFLIADDPAAKLIMICTGTGSAPFRGFTMHRQRAMPDNIGSMKLFFGARTSDGLPYFGPLEKVPQDFLEKHFAFSRVPGKPKAYVQDRLRDDGEEIAKMLIDPNTHIYVCGLKAMETGVEAAFHDIADKAGLNWQDIRAAMLKAGRYQIETY
ncbi:MAG: benzoyl-CoA 2,3-dioxygenase component A [Paracoccaceae bacterium]|jgi:benzoyl-CoA 2,3-dioxygenase component A